MPCPARPALAAALAAGLTLGVPAAEAPTPAEAFGRLKALAGDWQGTILATNGPATAVNYRLTAGGRTVMETLFGGTGHEMVSMYHLDGADLVLTHYCAMGNQPRMRYAPGRSAPDRLMFEFAGGTNLPPAEDVHMHEGWIRWAATNRIEAAWTLHGEGKPLGTNAFFLVRAARP
jgi:hypothetical protein